MAGEASGYKGELSYGSTDASSAAAYGGKTGTQFIDNSSGGGSFKLIKTLAFIGGVLFLWRLFKK